MTDAQLLKMAAQQGIKKLSLKAGQFFHMGKPVTRHEVEMKVGLTDEPYPGYDAEMHKAEMDAENAWLRAAESNEEARWEAEAEAYAEDQWLRQQEDAAEMAAMRCGSWDLD